MQFPGFTESRPLTALLWGVEVGRYDSGPQTAPHKVIYFILDAVTVVSSREINVLYLYTFYINIHTFAFLFILSFALNIILRQTHRTQVDFPLLTITNVNYPQVKRVSVLCLTVQTRIPSVLKCISIVLLLVFALQNESVNLFLFHWAARQTSEGSLMAFFYLTNQSTLDIWYMLHLGAEPLLYCHTVVTGTNSVQQSKCGRVKAGI